MAPPRQPGRKREPGQSLPRGHRVCNVEGCGNNAKQGGVCIRHGARVAPAKKCGVPGCNSSVKRAGLCLRHGGKLPPCTVVGCVNDANTVDGLCVKHGGRQQCSTKGCDNLAKKGGVCCKHGAQPKPICKVDGCTTLSYTRGVCIKHGAKTYKYVCSYGDCQNRPKLKGVCKRHGDEWRVCKHDGCEHIARKGGACTRHTPKTGSLAEQAIGGDGASISLAQRDGLCRTVSAERDVAAEDAAALLVQLHGDNATTSLAEGDDLCRTVSEEAATDCSYQGKKRATTEQGTSVMEDIGPPKKRVLREPNAANSMMSV